MTIARTTMIAGSTLVTVLLVGCAGDEFIAKFTANHGRPDGGPWDASSAGAARMQESGGSGGQGQGGNGGALPSGSGGHAASGGASASGGATTAGGATSSGGATTTGGAGNSGGGVTVKDGGHRDASENRDAADAQDGRALRDALASRDAIGDVGAPDVGLDASTTGDAHAICVGDGATNDQPWGPPDICGVTLGCNFDSDPCSRSRCVTGGLCLTPVASPNGTPCDDGKPSTFSHSAKDGCPSNKCIGGANAGLSCTADADCPGSSCFMNRCIDGPNAGSACETNADCSGGAPNANCIQQAGHASYCDGGNEAGHFCPSFCETTGGQCAVAGDGYCPRTCVGGTNPGTKCSPIGGQCVGGGVCTNHCLPVPNSPSCPPAGRCVRWSADPATNTCVATDDSPHCDTVADCPTTKYCAGDPEHEGASSISCEASSATDDCCVGGGDIGPCLVWDTCDTAHHVCVRTHQGGQTATCGSQSPTRFVYGATMCAGGPYGSGGTICNDECRAGKCTSAFFECR